MPIAINGSGTVTGISVGGLPDGIVDADMLAANAVTTAKLATDSKQGLAKAWINFDGRFSDGIRDSCNVSSLTDEGTGHYTITLTAAMANTNYAVVSSGHYITTESGNVREVGANTLATGSYKLNVTYNGSDKQDAASIYSAVFGD